ncbi:hypothetical protein [Roseovarius ramblicola]|uniref:Uncharacterized protein n=1 Tax=Roseovarius ramblicola TaxID=2022336 RepID=A0ABV5HZ09_9RHOB
MNEAKPGAANVYASQLLTKELGFPVEFDTNLSPIVSQWSETCSEMKSRTNAIKNFFSGTISFAISSTLSADQLPLRSLLLGGREHGGFDLAAHRAMAENVSLIPKSYRTDEPVPGKIAEIQCPGSVWAEYCIALDAFDRNAGDAYVRRLHRHLFEANRASTAHHLLDNSSRPLTSLYLIQRLRRTCHVSFFGFDKITDRECRLVRSHSFKGLVSQNIFSDRLAAAAKDEVVFDYPPTQIFDQKLPLALPFHPLTKHYYSDDIRKHIAPTYLLSSDLNFFTGTEKLSLDSVMSWPRQRRPYVLKYAGQDTTRNWGSRAVFMLNRFSKRAWANIRDRIVSDLQRGEPWIVQEDLSRKQSMQPVLGGYDTGQNSPNLAYEKSSIFVAGDVTVGAATMYRKTSLVHGQQDTILRAYTIEAAGAKNA